MSPDYLLPMSYEDIPTNRISHLTCNIYCPLSFAELLVDEKAPSKKPAIAPTSIPATVPTSIPTNIPTSIPTNIPTQNPTYSPNYTIATAAPTTAPDWTALTVTQVRRNRD